MVTSITKAGNTHARRLLVEAAWHHKPSYRPGNTMLRRWNNAPGPVVARAHLGNQRLHQRWLDFDHRNKRPVIAYVAIARELAGWVLEPGHHVGQPETFLARLARVTEGDPRFYYEPTGSTLDKRQRPTAEQPVMRLPTHLYQSDHSRRRPRRSVNPAGNNEVAPPSRRRHLALPA